MREKCSLSLVTVSESHHVRHPLWALLLHYLLDTVSVSDFLPRVTSFVKSSSVVLANAAA